MAGYSREDILEEMQKYEELMGKESSSKESPSLQENNTDSTEDNIYTEFKKHYPKIPDYSDNAIQIYKSLYFHPEETLPEQTHDRLARTIASSKKEYDIFKFILDNKMFRPNSPCIMNARSDNYDFSFDPKHMLSDFEPHDLNLFACYVLKLEDTMQSIMDMWSDCAKIYAGGAGAGIPFSNLRELNSVISVGGVASGPLAYGNVINVISDTVKSGGRCLAPYQTIYTEKGAKTVEDLADRDKDFVILSFDKKQNRVMAKRARAYKSGRKLVYSLITDKGEYHLSYDHPVLLKTGEYVQVKDLKPNMRLCGTSPCVIDEIKINLDKEELAIDEHLISNITKLEVMDVYDVEVDCVSPDDGSMQDSHNFLIFDLNAKNNYAGSGIIVHNSRRAANLFSFKYNHPDIRKVITCKTNGVDFNNFNISILVDDWFMGNVYKGIDATFDLISPNGNKPVGKATVFEIWNMIVKTAWETGDPGLLFYDTCNRMNPIPSRGEIVSSNPCIVGDTYVAVADGRGKVKIKDLAEEEKDILVYCSTFDNKIVTRRMFHPRKTGEKVEIVKVWIEGITPLVLRSLRVTKNHKFLLADGSSKEASELCVGDTLRLMHMTKEAEKDIVSFDNNTTAFINYNSIPSYKKENGFVKRICENCGISFKVPYEQREKSYCDTCILIKDSYYEPIDSEVKVVNVENDGCEDVYNGTVFEYHNMFIGGFEEKTESGKLNESFINTKNCGEVVIPPGCCCLGAINLLNCLSDNTTFDKDKFKWLIKQGTIFLDNMIDRSSFPNFYFEEAAKSTRSIGLGLMGFSDLLFKLKIPYGSDESVELFENICRTLTRTAFHTSIDLAEEKGSILIPEVDKAHFEDLLAHYEISEEYSDKYKRTGIRNSTVSSVAPTGSVSISADCSYAFEPCFALVWEKELVDRNVKLQFFNHFFKEECVVRGIELNENRVKEIVKARGSIQNLDYPSDMKAVFITAHDVGYQKKVKMQRAGQRWITLSISSTVNMPNSATEADISEAYKSAWKNGTKGITIYRDGCKANQPVNFGGESKTSVSKRPITRGGITTEVKTPHGKLFVTSNFTKDGKYLETFLRMGKVGHFEYLLLDALAIAISKYLQTGANPKALIDSYEDTGGWKFYFKLDENDQTRSAESLIDALAITMSNHMGYKIELSKDFNGNGDDPSLEKCPMCGKKTLTHNAGCKGGTCIDSSCGFSACG